MNQKQFDDFKAMVQPGDILFVSNNSFVLKIIQEGQKLSDKMWTNEIGHAAFIDSDLNIQESSIDKVKGKWVSGILIRSLDAWFDKTTTTKYLIIMRLDGITSEQVKNITEVGKHIQSKNNPYPVPELFGKLLSSMNYNMLGMLKWINKPYFEKLQQELLLKHNPLDGKGMYCICYANHCFDKGASFRLIPTTVDESNCTVGDGFKNIDRAYTLKFVVPGQYRDYHKDAGQVFGLDLKA